ncbi:hypothetical protein ACWGK5_32240 [Rhodococcus qingshengii]
MKTTVRRRIAEWMRRRADEIDPTSAPRSFGAYANFDPRQGWKVTLAGYAGPTSRMPGVPLWYMTHDRDRGFTDLEARA